MPLKLTCIQAYKIVYHFLDNIYFQTYDEFLSDILSGAALYSNIADQEPETMDPAIFNQWMNSVKIIMHDETITYNVAKLTTKQTYAAMHQYFITYCNLGAEPSVQKMRDLLNPNIEQCDVTKWLQIQWLQSVDFILQETSIDKIGHLFGDETGLTQRESFAVMKIFLDIFCKRNDNDDLIQLLQNSRLKHRGNYWSNIPEIIESRIWNVWFNAIEIILEQEKNMTLSLLNSYKAMPIFLMNYFEDHPSNFIDKVIQKFEIDQDNKPVNFVYWCAWTSAAVKLNAEQTEIVNNLVSINTAISQDTACKIIQTWFAKYDNFLDTKFMATVSTDARLWQQAVYLIKQSPRSYLLLDDEITVLEAYHIMVKLLELVGQNIDEFTIDPEQKNKPKDFEILLEWIMICEQIIKKH